MLRFRNFCRVLWKKFKRSFPLWRFLWSIVKRMVRWLFRLSVIGCRLTLLVACGVTSVALVNLGLAYPAAGGVVLAIAAYKRLRRWQGSGFAYGTARLANFLDLCRAGFLTNGNGLVIGRASFTGVPTRSQALRSLCSPGVDSRQALKLLGAAFFKAGGRSLIRIHAYVNIAVFAACGAGKGVGIVLPILLSYFGPVVVTDPKGENVRMSSATRRRNGHTVIVLDPFGISGEPSAALNPLDMIDEFAPDFAEQVGDLADALIIVNGNEKEPHFPESAKFVLSCIIAFVCVVETVPENRTLWRVRYILQSRNRFNDAMVAMQQHTAFGGLIAARGHLLTWYVDRELGSVLSTITRFTAWLDGPAMQAITAESTFDPRKFKYCKATLFLVLPPERLKSLSPLMRLWISTMLRATTRGVADEKHPVLFLLDEAGHLGHMQILEDAVTLLRGYGTRLIFIYQSIGQVTESMGERAHRFLDNIGTQLFFGVNSIESAEHISKRACDFTLLIQSLNETNSFSRPKGGYSKESQGSVSRSRSITTSEMGRPLYRLDEVLRLSEEVGLLFHRNMPVIPIKLLKYYKEPEFKRGRIAAYREGLFLRAWVASLVALGCSLLLLVVSYHLPKLTVPVHQSQPSFEEWLMEGEPSPEAMYRVSPEAKRLPSPPVPTQEFGPFRVPDRSGGGLRR